MRNDPFHERGWAELVFFLVAPGMIGAFGLMMVIVMTYVIRQKLKASRPEVSRDRNG